MAASRSAPVSLLGAGPLGGEGIFLGTIKRKSLSIEPFLRFVGGLGRAGFGAGGGYTLAIIISPSIFYDTFFPYYESVQK
jgi:hypothetical protein